MAKYISPSLPEANLLFNHQQGPISHKSNDPINRACLPDRQGSDIYNSNHLIKIKK